MKNYYRITPVIIFILVFFIFVGCSTIKILSPSEDQKYITTPYDLKVGHTGCGRVQLETFSAWLDKGTEVEQEITGSFTYTGSWTAQNYELPLGSHELYAYAGLEKPNRCCSDASDKRRFIVSQPTCIMGKVAGYWTDPSQNEPLSGASIKIYRAGTNTLVAEGVSDEEGNYCIDRVPLGMLVDIAVAGFLVDPCSGGKNDIDTGLIPNSCPDCIAVDFIVSCFPR